MILNYVNQVVSIHTTHPYLAYKYIQMVSRGTTLGAGITIKLGKEYIMHIIQACIHKVS